METIQENDAEKIKNFKLSKQSFFDVERIIMVDYLEKGATITYSTTKNK